MPRYIEEWEVSKAVQNRTPKASDRANLIARMEAGEQLSQDELKIVAGKQDVAVKPKLANASPREIALSAKRQYKASVKEVNNTINDLNLIQNDIKTTLGYYDINPATGTSQAQDEANQAFVNALAGAYGVNTSDFTISDTGVIVPTRDINEIAADYYGKQGTRLVQEAKTFEEAAKAAEIIAAKDVKDLDVNPDYPLPDPDSDLSIDPDTGEAATQFVEWEYNADFTKRRAKYFNSITGEFTYDDWEDAPKTKEDFDAEQAAIVAQETELNQKRDAFALIEATMRSYGFDETELKEIIDYIQAGILNPKLGANQLVLQLRQLDSYKKRFAGNEQRRARGLNALSEEQYLQQEKDYAQYLRYYGQGRLANREQYATFIGNDIAPTELKGRLDVAVTRLDMADPGIVKQLKEYYPSINDADIVSYFLNPQDTLPELERKTTVAEIGAAARTQGLSTGLSTAERLASLGVDQQAAIAGYGKIAEILPEAGKLSAIYGYGLEGYGQAEGEQEVFEKLASAQRKRKRLEGREIAAFSGSSGINKASLGGPAIAGQL